MAEAVELGLCLRWQGIVERLLVLLLDLAYALDGDLQRQVKFFAVVAFAA